jgi:uncharacterized protein
MRIWLDQVREEPINWDETERVAVASLDRQELSELGPISWRGQVVFADPGFYLRGHLSYDQILSCNRCLAPIHEPASSEVELMILVERPGSKGEERGEHELKEGDMGVLWLDGEILETRPILLEQLQLNIPMKPLCRPDCKGLCPVCGGDRNRVACSCEEASPDPRWAALAAIKSRLNGGHGGRE